MITYNAVTVAFVGWLVQRAPILRPVLQEHLEDNLGEILPHPFMFEMRQLLEMRLVEEGETAEIGAVVRDLGDAYRADSGDIHALIQVSFLDDLSPAPSPADLLRRFFDSPGER